MWDERGAQGLGLLVLVHDLEAVAHVAAPVGLPLHDRAARNLERGGLEAHVLDAHLVRPRRGRRGGVRERRAAAAYTLRNTSRTASARESAQSGPATSPSGPGAAAGGRTA